MKPLPPISNEPSYGYFPRWPQDGDAWVHPDDVGIARGTIPSFRIWRREGSEGRFHVLRYGDTRLRALPAMWREAPFEGFEVGDHVEVRSHGGQLDPYVGVIREVLWDEHASEVIYLLERAHTPAPDRYVASDLKHVTPPRPREEVRIEPKNLDDAFELATEDP